MITKPTVLVLGAGASIPYGYPSGKGLLQEISLNIGNSRWVSPILQCNIEQEVILQFRDELILSQQPSVDAFLEHRNEYVEIGKLSIALALFSHESEEKLFRFETRDIGCYHYLFDQLNSGWEEFSKNTLSIITFNYDRSLEHFLFTALKHTYNKTDDITAEALTKIPIIHVHGWLGPLPWQAAGGKPYMKQNYPEQNIRVSELKNASELILIQHEGDKSSIEFRQAYDCLCDAERIYFLGFGYHTQNMERLKLRDLNCKDLSLDDTYGDKYTRKISYRGSALGLGTSQLQSLQRKWNIGLLDNFSDSLNFLKEHTIME